MNKSDKIIATGAAGLVGSALVDHLRSEGYENVFPLQRADCPLQRADCDLLDTPATFALFERRRPNVVDALGELTGMSGRIEWDPSKPNGQAYRAYDLSKIKSLGFNPACSLRAGLRREVDMVLRPE